MGYNKVDAIAELVAGLTVVEFQQLAGRKRRKSQPTIYFGPPAPNSVSGGHEDFVKDLIGLIGLSMECQALHIVRRPGLYCLVFSKCSMPLFAL